MVAVWGCLPRKCLLRGWALLVWVWVLFGIGDGWPGVGSCGADWGCWVAALDSAVSVADALRLDVLRKSE